MNVKNGTISWKYMYKLCAGSLTANCYSLPRPYSHNYALGFYNPMGAFVIAGLHGLPLYLYAYQHHQEIPYLNEWSTPVLLVPAVVLVTGRVMGMAAEVRCMIHTCQWEDSEL